MHVAMLIMIPSDWHQSSAVSEIADGEVSTDRLRRGSLVATRPGEGPFTEPLAGTRLGSQELMLLPHTRP